MFRFKTLPKILLSALALLFLGSQAVQAADPIYTSTFSELAISGYDAVAYFREGKPTKGKEEFKTSYKGAVWRFGSADHLAAFEAEPEKYAPQYGGYCAYAVGAKKALVSADPEAWKIIDGKLYLNYDKDIQNIWAQDSAGYIQKADANWPALIK